ncbi:STAS domain-containing protein [Fulvivirga ligni]|uniref:STAS domain-containing protein n=1 Tax=Fulvivirga ligni TaxID=2904246 RepID=UPI001F3D0BF4|nr:STAS domain-containing protein [Fulvivirga ligni]UII21069.1 STAS domain-containing protein [Fulvivirga ligni]
MNYNFDLKEDVLVLSLEGDLIGEDSGADLMDKISGYVQEGVRLCVVDISELRYINSSGIGVLITILTKFRNKGGEVCLLKPSESVQKLLIITKLNAIFSVVDTEEEAFENLKSA